MSDMGWLTDDGCKAIKVMGWPEWEDRGRYCGRVCLGVNKIGFFFQDATEERGFMHLVTDHVAACILRDHAIQWLTDHTHALSVEFEATHRQNRAVGKKWAVAVAALQRTASRDSGWVRCHCAGDYPDAALIAQIVATQQEKTDE